MAITLTEAAAARHVTRYLRRRGKGWVCAWASRPPAARAWPTSSNTWTRSSPKTWCFENHGVKVLIDPKSLAYIDGTELDFVREGLNEGFKFNNPNERTAAAAARASGSEACFCWAVPSNRQRARAGGFFWPN
jgi:iron-sulfur cluster assembly protein